MDELIRYALTHALGTTRGNAAFAVYEALKTNSTTSNTQQEVLLVVAQWALGQLLGTEKGAAAFATIEALLAGG